MPKAIVNRMWGHFLGYGFTKPVDDIGPHNAPSHPELLEKLAVEFRRNSCDLKDLIRWIVLSEPYALSSHYSANNKKDDPSLGEKPMFSHFYLRQMRAEELYESLLVATAAHQIGGSYEEQEKVKHEWLDQFTHRLRHRRQRRNHDLQRHDSSDADDDERRPDEKSDRHRQRQLPGTRSPATRN